MKCSTFSSATLIGVLLVSCGDSQDRGSQFKEQPTSSDAGGSTKGTLTDVSILRGPCSFPNGDAGPGGLWECPRGYMCISMEAVNVVGANCRGSECPMCVRDDITNFRDVVKCDDPARKPYMLLWIPPTLTCG